MLEFTNRHRRLIDTSDHPRRRARRDRLVTVTYGPHDDLAVSITGAIAKYAPRYAPAQLHDAGFLRNELARLGAEVDGPQLKGAAIGALQLALFEEVAGHQLWDPTYIVDYPVEVSPLARGSDTRPGITERFELFITGREIANGFSELNDPEDQAERFLRQVEAKDAGDDGRCSDADYIRALSTGCRPPAVADRHRPAGHAAHRQPEHPRRRAVPRAARNSAPRLRIGRPGVSSRSVGAAIAALGVTQIVGWGTTT